MKTVLIYLLVFLTFEAFAQKRSFPNFSIEDANGVEWTQENLKGKTSIVILFHLGCPGAMSLLNDLDSMKSIYPDLQVIALAENTRDQIDQFYSDEENDWSPIRKYYKTKVLTYPLLPECSEEYKKDGEVVITTQCRKVSRKLWTKSSPTILLVDSKGQIQKKKKGYIAFSPIENRMEWIKTFKNGY